MAPPIVKTPQQIRHDLEHELKEIQKRTPNDHKWFFFQKDGTLGLYDRPSHWYSWIPEIIGRIILKLFYGGKFQPLSSKMVTLLRDVESYLGAEGSDNERGNFLNTYTVGLAGLYEGANKIVRKTNLSVPSLPRLEKCIRTPKTNTRFVIVNQADIPISVQITYPSGFQSDKMKELGTDIVAGQTHSVTCSDIGFGQNLALEIFHQEAHRRTSQNVHFFLGLRTGEYRCTVPHPPGPVTLQPLVKEMKVIDISAQRLSKDQDLRLEFSSQGVTPMTMSGSRGVLLLNSMDRPISVQLRMSDNDLVSECTLEFIEVKPRDQVQLTYDVLAKKAHLSNYSASIFKDKEHLSFEGSFTYIMD